MQDEARGEEADLVDGNAHCRSHGALLALGVASVSQPTASSVLVHLEMGAKYGQMGEASCSVGWTLMRRP